MTTPPLKVFIPPLDFSKIEKTADTPSLSDSDETKQKKRDEKVAAQKKVFFDDTLSFLESEKKLTISLSNYKTNLNAFIETHEKYLESLIKNKMATDEKHKYLFTARCEVFKELDAGLSCIKAGELFIQKLSKNASKTTQKVILSEIDVEIIRIFAERNMVTVLKKTIETMLIPFAKDPQLCESILEILEKVRQKVI